MNLAISVPPPPSPLTLMDELFGIRHGYLWEKAPHYIGGVIYANNRIQYGLKIVFVCLYCEILYQRNFFTIIVQNYFKTSCVFSLSVSLMVIVKICVLYLIIIMKSKLWIVSYFKGEVRKLGYVFLGSCQVWIMRHHHCVPLGVSLKRVHWDRILQIPIVFVGPLY